MFGQKEPPEAAQAGWDPGVSQARAETPRCEQGVGCPPSSCSSCARGTLLEGPDPLPALTSTGHGWATLCINTAKELKTVNI